MTRNIGELFRNTPDPRSYVSDPSLVYDSLAGVEVELEGVSPGRAVDGAPAELLDFWRFTEDGSLRGPHFEAVLANPLCGRDYTRAIELFTSYCNGDLEGRLNANFRTSLHLHVDVRDLTPNQLAKMILLYLVVELPLFHYVGNDRDKSNFCIPYNNLVELLDGVQSLYSGDLEDFITTVERQGKYSAMNLLPISRFGSLEFRQHPGTYNYEDIILWTNLILSLKKWAVESHPDPGQFPEYFSGIGPSGIAREVFGDLFRILDYPEFESDSYFGIRRVQELVHARDMEERSKNLIKTLRGKSKNGLVKSKKTKKTTSQYQAPQYEQPQVNINVGGWRTIRELAEDAADPDDGAEENNPF